MTAIRRTAPVAPRQPVRQAEVIKGKVSIKTVAAGSKSQHKSLVMTVKGKTVQLQRLGGNPFEIDAKERALAGKSVELKGYFINDHLFRYTQATTAKQ